MLAFADAASEPELGGDVADPDPNRAERDAHADTLFQDEEDQEEHHPKHDRRDSLDAEPVGDAQVPGITCEGEPLLGAFGE